MPGPPLIVVEGARAEYERAVDELEQDGWTVHHGWDYGQASWGLEASGVVCAGTVRSREDAAEVLLAAARGAGVVAAVDANRDLLERVFADLSRLGEVEFRGARSDPLSGLDDEQRELLARLADGDSIDEVAAKLGYSRRTISRRLAALRDALGVDSTAEALALAQRYSRQKLE